MDFIADDGYWPAAQACGGPLVWFDTTLTVHCRDCGNAHGTAAVLACAACGYLVTTGNFHDEAHANTPIMREGYAYG